jgi:dTDP-4-amino-4,6-dideoxygalactose transaminase
VKIPFNSPYLTGKEQDHLGALISGAGKFSGDGTYTKKCTRWFIDNIQVAKVLFTPSCTHALEMAAMLLDIREGDEVILPSFTFVSTANAFALRGARLKFVDIRPDTLNIDEKLIEQAITSKTKAIVLVHYAGVSCEMDAILNIARKYGLHVVEDAAQALGSTYKGQHCGTFGNFGTISFHETKNIHCGEGGCLYVNDEKHLINSEIIREKGTNRAQFLRGHVDKYTWRSIGSSYLLSEINTAFLLPQLESLHTVTEKRLNLWGEYYSAFEALEKRVKVFRPTIPTNCQHNGHIFYLITEDSAIRNDLLGFLNDKNIGATFHYIPLHSTETGKKYGEFVGDDNVTTDRSERLVRLPLHYGMNTSDIARIVEMVEDFYHG